MVLLYPCTIILHRRIALGLIDFIRNTAASGCQKAAAPHPRLSVRQIMIRAKKAVNQASINQQDVLSFRMFVPPLELQEQFAAFVEQTDKSKVVVQDEVNGL